MYVCMYVYMYHDIGRRHQSIVYTALLLKPSVTVFTNESIRFCIDLK